MQIPQQKNVVKTIALNQEQSEHLTTLYDSMVEEQNASKTMALWKYLYGLYPEVNEGTWELRFNWCTGEAFIDKFELIPLLSAGGANG